MGKKSRVVTFMVVQAVDGGKSQHVLYRGPEKRRAREVAQKQLGEGVKELAVLRVTQATVLTEDDLAAALPKDAF
jgi:hypothetical protein